MTRAVHARAGCALAVISVLWAYNWVVMKRALEDGGPLEFTAARSVFATVALFALLVVLRLPLRCPSIKGAIAVGMMQTVGTGALGAAALVTGGAGRTAVLVYLMPFWTLLLARLTLSERVRGWQWLAVALAAGGLVLILSPWDMRGTLAASLFAVAAGVCWSAAAITAKKLRIAGSVGIVSLTAWQMLFGTIALILLAHAFPSKPIEWTPYMIWAIFYNAVPVSALGWLLWLYALDRLPAGTASMGMLAVPVLGMAAAAIDLGERPTGWESAGMLLILAGLAVLATLALREHRRDDPMSAQE